jgi:catechol 2,3-dioxygenase-like lactoylglutathione lyase family enzyme
LLFTTREVAVFEPTTAYSGFSVDDLATATEFYSSTLGLTVTSDGVGSRLRLPGGAEVFMYSKPDHQPASFTILNFEVEDIDAAVDELVSRGITFERYEGSEAVDAKGIMRGRAHNIGPDIAWFLDPARNVISVIH